ncbi:MAG: hypothetical protein JST42_14170 [Bacteroidetes bacterium]|nr:hypothetical protein [Bacteroidota bacterium]
MRELLLFLGLSSCITSFARDSVKVTDLLKIRSIGDIKLNRDGTRAVYTVKSIEPGSGAIPPPVTINRPESKKIKN